ncbi:MAG: hypothetical protein M0027_04170 [Candidatus Dormibacteraeota bacterium]|jgi:predicted nucleic acid-binding protein|nr:hypothetical protein [Candidatus Dormibacteraeota bacterium]
MRRTGGPTRADSQLLRDPTQIAAKHKISVYDAACVAATRIANVHFVGCDACDSFPRARLATQ